MQSFTTAPRGEQLQLSPTEVLSGSNLSRPLILQQLELLNKEMASNRHFVHLHLSKRAGGGAAIVSSGSHRTQHGVGWISNLNSCQPLPWLCHLWVAVAGPAPGWSSAVCQGRCVGQEEHQG